jgi:Omp85 superfamily domain
MRRYSFAITFALGLLAAPAAAQPASDFLVRGEDPFTTPSPEEPASPPEAPPPAGASEPGSASPSYDANRNQPPTAPEDTRGLETPPGTSDEDVVLAVPRALLFLPNLALKTVFLPLRGLATVIDEYALVERTKNLLYFNDEETAGIFPTFTAQTAYGLSLGARIFHNDLFGHEEHISARATYGGLFQQGYQLLFEGDSIGGSRLWLETRVRYEKKPGILFYGLGDAPKGSSDLQNIDPRAASVPTRFRQERFLGLLRLGPTLGRRGNLTQVGVTTSYNRRVFGSEERDFDEPTIGDVYDTTMLEGFHDTLHLVEVDLNVNHDSTDHREFPSGGVFMELFGGRASSFNDYAFWHFGAELAGFINLYRGDRVLVLRGAFEGVDGEASDIPFIELPRLGGAQRLRGYVEDRFRDELAAVATVEYRYPVHDFVSGHLFVDAGRVGRTDGQLFGADAYEDWRTGAGGGFTIHSQDREDVIFRVELGYGDAFTALISTEPLRAFTKRSRQL